jgi:hypothetical protein
MNKEKDLNTLQGTWTGEAGQITITGEQATSEKCSMALMWRADRQQWELGTNPLPAAININTTDSITVTWPQYGDAPEKKAAYYKG